MAPETTKEDAPKLDEAAILEKHNRGEELTPEETEFIAGNPNAPIPAPDEEGEEKTDDEKPAEEETTDGDETTEEEEPGSGSEAAPTKEAAEKKPTEKGPKATPEETAERRKLIDAELEKPEGEENLAQFTDTEIGLYWDLKKARKKNQRVEQENRELRFEKTQERLKKAKEKPAEEAEEDPLKDRSDDDVVTVGEIRKLFAKKQESTGTESEGVVLRTREEIRVESTEAENKLLKQGVKDFSDVIGFAEAALKGDKDAQRILAETAIDGGNVAEKTYWLIRGSKAWPKIKKQIEDEAARATGTKKEPDPNNVARGKRIEKNAAKTRTTGAGATGGGTTAGEYTIKEILDMRPEQFGKLSKEKQEAILQKFGSDPNRSV